jgi:hypothetical protein
MWPRELMRQLTGAGPGYVMYTTCSTLTFKLLRPVIDWLAKKPTIVQPE